MPQFLHEPVGVEPVSLADEKERNELSVPVKGDEDKLISGAIALFMGEEPLLMLTYIRPNLVRLDVLAGEAPESLAHVPQTGVADTQQKPNNGVSMDSGKSLDASDAVSLDKQVQDHFLFLSLEPIHDFPLDSLHGKADISNERKPFGLSVRFALPRPGVTAPGGCYLAAAGGIRTHKTVLGRRITNPVRIPIPPQRQSRLRGSGVVDCILSLFFSQSVSRVLTLHVDSSDFAEWKP